MVELADRLYELMREKDITRGELAKGTRISKGKLDKIFAGFEKASNFELKMMAQVLEVDIESIHGLNGTAQKQIVEPLKHAPNVMSATSGTRKDAPLIKISDDGCIKDGLPIAGSAHYNGMLNLLFGKGIAKKCHNLLTAELCDDCHKDFDSNAHGRKSMEASHDFMKCILLTIIRRYEAGKIIVKA
jgi:hypothetical protein